jgi:hypothetical protein
MEIKHCCAKCGEVLAVHEHSSYQKNEELSARYETAVRMARTGRRTSISKRDDYVWLQCDSTPSTSFLSRSNRMPFKGGLQQWLAQGHVYKYRNYHVVPSDQHFPGAGHTAGSIELRIFRQAPGSDRSVAQVPADLGAGDDLADA